jgi:hypothetical protein
MESDHCPVQLVRISIEDPNQDSQLNWLGLRVCYASPNQKSNKRISNGDWLQATRERVYSVPRRMQEAYLLFNLSSKQSKAKTRVNFMSLKRMSLR